MLQHFHRKGQNSKLEVLNSSVLSVRGREMRDEPKERLRRRLQNDWFAENSLEIH